VFCLQGEEWALPAGRVRQVLAPRPVTRVPGADSSLLGLISWHANVIPVLGLGRRASGPLLVVEEEGEFVALAVDEVKHFAEQGRPGSVPPLLDLEQVLDER
jgi:chemotaxis signal transduction protein